jgi:methylmalonyl-CoA epimerase
VLPYNIDHVAIAVQDLDDAIDRFERYYQTRSVSREIVEDQDVEEAMIPVGGSRVQLIRPLSEDGPVARFLDKRGEGLHHIAFAVPDVELALEHLRSSGARLVDHVPRIGGGGNRIAFVHPTSFGGTLVELVEVTE